MPWYNVKVLIKTKVEAVDKDKALDQVLRDALYLFPTDVEVEETESPTAKDRVDE